MAGDGKGRGAADVGKGRGAADGYKKSERTVCISRDGVLYFGKYFKMRARMLRAPALFLSLFLT